MSQTIENSILITGATGTIGKELLRSLSAQLCSKRVKVLVRNVEKAKELLVNYTTNLSVEYVLGDLDCIESIPVSSFENIERLFVLTLSSPDQPKVERQLVELVLKYSKNSLKQIIRLSGLGASLSVEPNSLFRYHIDSEIAIGNLLSSGDYTNVSYTILRPNLFMQNFLRDDIQSIQQTQQFFKPRNDHGAPYHITHVDVRDIAEMSSQILTQDPIIHKGQVYNITGPQSLNYDQIAQIISKSIGKTITWARIDEIDLALQLSHLPKYLILGLVRLYQFYKLNGITANVHCDFEMVMGRKSRSFEKFVDEHKDFFK